MKFAKKNVDYDGKSVFRLMLKLSFSVFHQYAYS